ncbi:DsrE/DsrF/DrsH-like family protein [Amycolatopsis alkalitolerans]|uniref:Sulfur reduction protein DsrE n=1 Tax=Amycolatopsis alkalitolerans TaxID=2547244 RepID=A0A5C4M5Q3_9PSEU|nr:DsrE/DsrF/DrsH-like family protein [Amycolatopsis alkalitolerans]TNC25836.1 sulfur reduction protein DsrE [Amycolatopsis alkalitolerans]
MWSGEFDSKILYVQTHGVTDPGRSATPFFLAASAAAMDCEVMIYFTMYGPTLLQRDVVDKIGPKGDRGQPLRHFIEQATSLGVRLLVCQPSLDLNDLSLDSLIDGVDMIGGAAFNDLAINADAVISF